MHIPRHTLCTLALIPLLAACATTPAHHPGSRRGHLRAPYIPSDPGSSGSPGKLLQVHDPGQVTYSLTITSCHMTGSGTDILQDPHCTPGAIDPAVTQANIRQTICSSGYTKTVRPPVSDTAIAKRRAYAAYGIAPGTISELDHLVSLELGGSNDIANLWPEPGRLPNPKDSVENNLHRAVCEGRTSLAAAQKAIATDWRTAEQRLGLS